jgi:HlyD family secretion protein
MRNFLARRGQNEHQNGKPADSQNGNQTSAIATTDGSEADKPDAPAINKLVRTDAFDQPVILQQTSIWSRGIVWGIVGVTTFGILWAIFARIEEAVPATGKLEPQAQVQEVQAPNGGVVEEILVEEGDRVEQGEILIRFDPRATRAQIEALEEVRDSLVQENRFYRSQLLGLEGPTLEEALDLDLPPEMLQLTANRSALLQENQLYQAMLQGGSTEGLNPAQLSRLRVGMLEAESRASAARLEISQLQQQLSQTQGQLNTARQSLQIDQSILDRIEPLAEEGGIAELQLMRQEQEVLNARAEVDRLAEEVERLRFAISQAEQQLQNTVATTDNDLLNRIAQNDQRLAEIDSQLNKAIVENEKQIAELNSQLEQARVNLEYQELRAPIDGVVFDLQARGPGFVANTSEPILKIVPGEGLIASVFITNQDIGFVQEGMDVDVRIDSFPFSEFGDVTGTVTQIGSDALPPNEIYPFYRFPATVELETQYLEVNGNRVPLQSGMSVTTNIIVRDRRVITLFSELFTNTWDSLRTVR